jgi:hypothetical protein
MPFPFVRPAVCSIVAAALAGAGPVAPPPERALPAESVAFRATQLREAGLRPIERLPAYLARNFGPLWTHTAPAAVFGFIGPHYQRLEVKVLTARRSATDPAVYQLTGKTRVSGTVRAFSGTVRLEHLRVAVPRPRLGGDDRLPAGTREGVVVGRYALAEPASQPRTGTFRGVVATRWYVDPRGRLRYNDADVSASDGFCNNQYVGTWTSHATGRAVRCNWGDYRAPNAGPLDIGAGEFSADAKYFAYGWQGPAAADTWWK